MACKKTAVSLFSQASSFLKTFHIFGDLHQSFLPYSQSPSLNVTPRGPSRRAPVITQSVPDPRPCRVPASGRPVPCVAVTSRPPPTRYPARCPSRLPVPPGRRTSGSGAGTTSNNGWTILNCPSKDHKLFMLAQFLYWLSARTMEGAVLPLVNFCWGAEFGKFFLGSTDYQLKCYKQWTCMPLFDEQTTKN